MLMRERKKCARATERLLMAAFFRVEAEFMSRLTVAVRLLVFKSHSFTSGLEESTTVQQ